MSYIYIFIFEVIDIELYLVVQLAQELIQCLCSGVISFGTWGTIYGVRNKNRIAIALSLWLLPLQFH